MYVARRLGSPVSAWEAPVPTSHSPQHSTASSSNVSITATPTISPGVSSETQLSSSQPQLQLQQLSHSANQSNFKPPVARRLGNKRNSRPMSMANFFEHTTLDTPSTSGAQRRGLYCVLNLLHMVIK